MRMFFSNKQEIFKLVEQGIEIKASHKKDGTFKTRLFSFLQTAEKLIQKDPTVLQAIDEKGRNPLFFAAESGQLHLLALFLHYLPKDYLPNDGKLFLDQTYKNRTILGLVISNLLNKKNMHATVLNEDWEAKKETLTKKYNQLKEKITELEKQIEKHLNEDWESRKKYNQLKKRITEIEQQIEKNSNEDLESEKATLIEEHNQLSKRIAELEDQINKKKQESWQKIAEIQKEIIAEQKIITSKLPSRANNKKQIEVLILSQQKIINKQQQEIIGKIAYFQRNADAKKRVMVQLDDILKDTLEDVLVLSKELLRNGAQLKLSSEISILEEFLTFANQYNLNNARELIFAIINKQHKEIRKFNEQNVFSKNFKETIDAILAKREIFSALENNNIDLINELIFEDNTVLSKQNKDFLTPLHFAILRLDPNILKRYKKIFEIIITSILDLEDSKKLIILNLQDKDGKTPLDKFIEIDVEQVYSETIISLIEHGARINFDLLFEVMKERIIEKSLSVSVSYFQKIIEISIFLQWNYFETACDKIIKDQEGKEIAKQKDNEAATEAQIKKTEMRNEEIKRIAERIPERKPEEIENKVLFAPNKIITKGIVSEFFNELYTNAARQIFAKEVKESINRNLLKITPEEKATKIVSEIFIEIYQDFRRQLIEQKRNFLHIVLLNDNLKIAQALLKQTPSLLSSVDVYGDTPFHLAIKLRRNHFANLFLNFIDQIREEKNILVIKNNNGMTPLDILIRLKFARYDVLQSNSITSEAILANTNSLVLDFKDRSYLSSLKNQMNLILRLFYHGAAVNLDKVVFELLSNLADKNTFMDITRGIVYFQFEEFGKLVNVLTPKDSEEKFKSEHANILGIYKVLKEQKKDVPELHLAIQYNDIRKIQQLVENDGNLRQVDLKGRTAFHYMVIYRKYEILLFCLDVLFKKNIDIGKYLNQQIDYSATYSDANGDVKEVVYKKTVLQSFLDSLDASVVEDDTLNHQKEMIMEVISRCLNYGAKVNLDAYGLKCLSKAIKIGLELQVIRIISLQTDELDFIVRGKTVYDWAIANGDLKLLGILKSSNLKVRTIQEIKQVISPAINKIIEEKNIPGNLRKQQQIYSYEFYEFDPNKLEQFLVANALPPRDLLRRADEFLIEKTVDKVPKKDLVEKKEKISKAKKTLATAENELAAMNHRNDHRYEELLEDNEPLKNQIQELKTTLKSLEDECEQYVKEQKAKNNNYLEWDIVISIAENHKEKFDTTYGNLFVSFEITSKPKVDLDEPNNKQKVGTDNEIIQGKEIKKLSQSALLDEIDGDIKEIEEALTRKSEKIAKKGIREDAAITYLSDDDEITSLSNEDLLVNSDYSLNG